MDGLRIYKPICCSGVTLLEPFLSDTFDPNSVTKLLEPEHQALTLSIGKISPEGTCFIIAKPTRPLRLKNNKVVALALTNYHVAYHYQQKRKKKHCSVRFVLKDKSYRYNSQSLLELNSILSDIQYSRTSGIPYCLSNDIGLILIIESPRTSEGLELEEIEICNQEELLDEKNVIVSGFPVFSEYKYILPNVIDYDIHSIKVYKGYHNFVCQIISEGTVEISDSGLADLKLSATSGMSGSPILVKIENHFKCIGIYCGGCPVEGQHLLMKVLDALHNGNYKEALSLFEQLPFDNKKLFEKISRFKELQIIFYQFMMETNVLEKERFESEHPQEYEECVRYFADFRKDPSDSQLYHMQELIKSILIETTQLYRENGNFSYNAGILINTEAFKIVRRAIDIFRNIEGDFDEARDIKMIIRQFIA